MTLLRRLFSALFYYEHTSPAPVCADLDWESVDRLYWDGFAAEDAVWLVDFFTLTETALRVYDGAVARG